MTILGIGQSVFDVYLPLVKPFSKNGKQRIYNSIRCAGGPVTNAMILCGRWNADVSIITRIGKDAIGNEILRLLEENHVHTQSMIIDPTVQTSMSCILVDTKTGDRSILNMPLEIEEGPADVHWPDTADVILFDGHEIRISMDALDRYPASIKIFDGDKYKPKTIDLIRQCDYLVCSKEFAQEYTQHQYNKDTYAELQQLNRNVILTLGDQGCIYNGVSFSAYPAHSIDTTGAGDIFHGAFAYGLDQQWDIETIIKTASYAAARSTEKMGGMTSIPSLDEIYKGDF